MHTSLEIVRGMEFTTPALTAFSSLHADNQVVIASKLKLAETDLAEMMKDGEVKPITLPEKVQATTNTSGLFSVLIVSRRFKYLTF